MILTLFGGVPPKEAIPRAKDAARRSLAIDDSQADAHAVQAFLAALSDWEWEKAREEFDIAMALKPNHAAAHLYFAFFYLVRREFAQGIAQLKRAVDLDPLSLPFHTYLGAGYYWSGQEGQAVAQLEATVEIEPSYFEAHHFLGIVYLRQGRQQEALAEVRRAVELVDNPQTRMALGYLCGMMGQHDEARKIAEELEQAARYSHTPAYYKAIVYLGLEEFDRVLDWLEQGCEERAPNMPFIVMEPIFDPIRDEPRFQALLKKMRLE